MHAATTMLAVVGQTADAPSTGASAMFYIVIGLVLAVVVAFLGHSVWLWQRSRGPLRSADDTVSHLADGEVHDSGVYERPEDAEHRDRSA